MSENLQSIKKLLLLLAAYYEKDLEPEVLDMFAKDLQDLDFETVRLSAEIYRKNIKNLKFPLPVQLRSIAENGGTEDDQAAEIAARIIGAVSKYGWTNPESARVFIGPEGWEVVQISGGWTSLCQGLTHENKGTQSAQFRNCIKSILGKQMRDEVFNKNQISAPEKLLLGE